MEKLADYYSNFGTTAYKEFSLPAVHSQVRDHVRSLLGHMTLT